MLRSRVYDVTLTHDDVIGPFFKVTFPLHVVDLIDDSIFSSRLRDWKNPSNSWIFPSNMHCKLFIASEK